MGLDQVIKPTLLEDATLYRAEHSNGVARVLSGFSNGIAMKVYGGTMRGALNAVCNPPSLNIWFRAAIRVFIKFSCSSAQAHSLRTVDIKAKK